MLRYRLLFALLMSCVSVAGVAHAYDATPTPGDSALDSLGLPQLVVEVDGDSFALSADEIPGGRTEIILRNVHDEESWHGFLLRLPDDFTLEQLMATPESTGEDDAPPEFLFQSTFPGFPGETLAGHENRVVVDLSPGQYVIVGDTLQPFTVLDRMPVDVQPVVADAHVEIYDFSFTFPDDLAIGPQVWEVNNTGQQPHEILLAKSQVPITAEQVIALFSEEQNATPVAGEPTFDDIDPVGGIGWLSPGATGWTEVDLAPGYYVALCFVFDPATGMPHAMSGMVSVFTVGDEAA